MSALKGFKAKLVDAEDRRLSGSTSSGTSKRKTRKKVASKQPPAPKQIRRWYLEN